MLKARHSAFARFVMNRYLPYIIGRQFRGLDFLNPPKLDKNCSVLLLANHFSWWDGFTQYELNRRLLGKRYHVMMLEEELRKRPFLQGIGAFSVKKGTKSILETLSYTHEALNQPGNLVTIFPQGKIESLYQQDLTFEKGVFEIAKSLPENGKMLYSITLPEYGSYPKPLIRAHFKEPPTEAFKNFESLRSSFLDHYRRALNHQISTIE